MRDFEEFRKMIDSRFYESAGEVLEIAGEKIEFPITKENAGRFLAAVAGANLNMTLAILENYHTWLKAANTREIR